MARARSRSRGRRVSFKSNRGSDRDDVYSSPSKPKLHSRREDAEEHESATRPSNGKGTVRADMPDSDSFITNRGSDRDDVYSSPSKLKLRSRLEDAGEHKSTTRVSTRKGTVRADMPDSESFRTNRGSDRDDVYSSSSKPKLRSRREDAEEYKSTTRPSTGKGTVRADMPDSDSFKTNRGDDVYSSPFKPKLRSRRGDAEEHKSTTRPSTEKETVRADMPDSDSSKPNRGDDVYFSPSKPKLRSRREVPREHKSTTRPSNGKAVRAESPYSESFETDRGSDRDDVYSSPSKLKPRLRCEVVVKELKSTTRPPKKKGKTRAETSDLESSPEENPSNCESGRDVRKSYLRSRTPGPTRKIGLPKGINHGHDSKRRPKGVLEGA